MADLRSLLGCEFPLLQAPMAGAQDSALAITVSNAGGLGALPGALLGPDALRAELATIRAQTDKPYNVNFFCHLPPAPDVVREAAWRQLLAPYYDELGIDLANTAPGASRTPFNAAIADLLEEFRPPVLSFHFGLPTPELLARVRGWGARVLSTATTVDEARWLEAHGVDAIIAQGLEAGGHRGHFLRDDLDGQLALPELLAGIVAAVSCPVIAAGGIADVEGIRQAVALGASGVQIGTAYLLCPEATTTAVHRAALQSPAARDTAVTNLFTGRPARGIVNRLMRERGPMSEIAPEFPLAATALAPLRAAAESRGSGDFSPLWSGRHVRSAREIAAGEITRDLAGAFADSRRD